jgi:hypothetical protein
MFLFSIFATNVSAQYTIQYPMPSGKIIKNVDITFDTLSSCFSIKWQIDAAIIDINTDPDYEIGLYYSLDIDEDSINHPKENLVYSIDTTQPVRLTSPNEAFNIETSIIPFLFDTTIYLHLFTRKSHNAENWDQLTVIAYETPQYSRQLTPYYFTYTNKQDTAFAFNKSIQLWPTQNQQDQMISIDTVIFLKRNPSYNNFKIINPGFYFAKAEDGPKSAIGLKYDPKEIPTGYTYKDICVYRDSAGIPIVDYSTQHIPSKNIAYVITNERKLPFLLMIDIAKPEVIVKHQNAILEPTDEVSDTLIIRDNNPGVKYTLKYALASATGYTDSISGIYNTQKENFVVLRVNNQLTKILNPDCGMRALLTVTDGSNTKTLICNHQVVRSNSDPIQTSSSGWKPISVTSLTNFSSENLIAFIKDTLYKDNDLSYDNRYVRLFKWDTSIPPNGKYVEYTPETSPDFDFSPGKLYWIKTYKSININFGKGVTLPLIDASAVKIELAKNNTWTDLNLPYNFSLSLRDIKNATKDSDRLIFYKWVNLNGFTYTAQKLSIPAIDGDQDIELTNNIGEGYSVCNTSNFPITLVIPPYPHNWKYTSNNVPSVGKSANYPWHIKVKNKYDLSEIYLINTPLSDYKGVPCPPTFSKTRLSFSDSEMRSGKIIDYGNITQTNILNKEIELTNNSDKDILFNCEVIKSDNFPGDLVALIYNPETNQVETNSNITVKSQTTEKRKLIVANSTSIDHLLKNSIQKNTTLSIGKIVQNPGISTIKIPLTNPYSSNEIILLEIFDDLGRHIWSKQLHSNTLGINSFVLWDGRNSKLGHKVKSGAYIVRVSQKDRNGKINASALSRFTYLP